MRPGQGTSTSTVWGKGPCNDMTLTWGVHMSNTKYVGDNMIDSERILNSVQDIRDNMVSNITVDSTEVSVSSPPHTIMSNNRLTDT